MVKDEKYYLVGKKMSTFIIFENLNRINPRITFYIEKCQFKEEQLAG